MKTLKDYFECKAKGPGIDFSSGKNDEKVENENNLPTPSHVTPKLAKQLKTSTKKKPVVKINIKNENAGPTTKPIFKYFCRISAPGNSPAVKSSRIGCDNLVGQDESLGLTGSLD